MKKTTKKLSLSPETVRVLRDEQLKTAAGGVTATCLGQTDCQCANTFNTECPSAYTCGRCSANYSNCGCNGTAYTCEGYC